VALMLWAAWQWRPNLLGVHSLSLCVRVDDLSSLMIARARGFSLRPRGGVGAGQVPETNPLWGWLRGARAVLVEALVAATEIDTGSRLTCMGQATWLACADLTRRCGSLDRSLRIKGLVKASGIGDRDLGVYVAVDQRPRMGGELRHCERGSYRFGADW